jgi:asparagine synthase (glutamine-hydrolysing)
VPVEAWLAGPLREWAEDLLLGPSPTRDALLNGREIRRAWEGFLRGRTELALGIWSLVMFESWRRRWKIENLTREVYADPESR